MNIYRLVRDPAFYDIFGVLIFAFNVYIAINGLIHNGLLNEWILVTLLVLSIFGLVVDSIMVYRRFIT